jgi:hypothetical protein
LREVKSGSKEVESCLLRARFNQKINNTERIIMTNEQQKRLMQLAHNLRASAGEMQEIARLALDPNNTQDLKTMRYPNADEWRTENQEKLEQLAMELGEEWQVKCEFPHIAVPYRRK